MNLEVTFDDQTIRDYSSQGSGSFFGIRWSHDGEYYPSSDWTDFGAIILGWWISQIVNIHEQNKSGELLFMDGPYSITVSLHDDGEGVSCEFRNSRIRWTTSLEKIKAELSKGTRSVLAKLEQLNVDSNERRVLSSALSILSNKRR